MFTPQASVHTPYRVPAKATPTRNNRNGLPQMVLAGAVSRSEAPHMRSSCSAITSNQGLVLPISMYVSLEWDRYD